MWNPWLRLLIWRERARNKKLYEEFDDQPATPELVAQRFKTLFNLHGIETAEIPEIDGFENITLHDLNSDDRLIQKLTPDFLHKTAERFGIRIEWLRSGESNLYSRRYWYKNLKNFFEDLKEVDFEETYDPFFIITTREKLDVHDPEYQPFLVVLRKWLATLDDKDVYRYYTETEWDWHHPPCRLQAKALATQYYKLTRRMVTIYTTDMASFRKMAEGYLPPNVQLARNHKISLEEYGALTLNYREPYEQEEFDAIVETMREYEINDISYEYVSKTNQDSESATRPKRKRGRRPDEKKKEIKDRFLEAYGKKIYREEISAAQAARDFFLTLSEEERAVLFRSPEEYKAQLSYEEAEHRAVRTLTDYYANQKQAI
jgi:hypothetical protein